MENVIQLILSVIATGASSGVGFLFWKLKKHEEERDRLADEAERERKIRDDGMYQALCAICRDRINGIYKAGVKEKGLDLQDLETVNKLYAAYHALGGNGTVTTVHQKILQLPIKDS